MYTLHIIRLFYPVLFFLLLFRYRPALPAGTTGRTITATASNALSLLFLPVQIPNHSRSPECYHTKQNEIHPTHL